MTPPDLKLAVNVQAPAAAGTQAPAPGQAPPASGEAPPASGQAPPGPGPVRALEPRTPPVSVRLAGMPAREPDFPPGLLMDLQTAVGRLWRELERGPTLDAYLLACGVAQIADDHLHAPAYPFGRAASYLATREQRAASVAALAAEAAGSLANRAHSRRIPAREALERWRARHAQLVRVLAGEQVARLLERDAASPAGADTTARVPARAETLRALRPALGPLPVALRRSVVKLPSCFSHFDQRPADIVTLTQRFAAGRPDRARPLLVVGVRTSGSYLAPLCAATLDALGFERVRMLSVRPGHRMLRDERALIVASARAGGLALLLDDPPVSGRTLRDAVGLLERAGLPASAVTLLLATFGAPELPHALQGLRAVLLGGAEWSVERDLEPDAVKRTLSELCAPGRELLELEPLTPGLPGGPGIVGVPGAAGVAGGPARRRGHHRAVFRVRVREADGRQATQVVVVEGVGLGYLGAHRLSVPSLLERFSPRVLALRDGLLYREWVPDEQRLDGARAQRDQLPRLLAQYVAERQTALACPEDLSGEPRGGEPAWLVGSRILAGGFGRGWSLACVLAGDRAVRRALEVAKPSLVDGNTGLSQWFVSNDAEPALIKPDLGEDSFSNLTVSSFDAAFDLAGMTACSSSRELQRKLRDAFFELTGERVSPERWLLYELAHLWGRERTEPERRHALRRAVASAFQRYYAEVYLDAAQLSDAGPLCALDLDGVLETDHFGAPALTPSAALCLRTLRCHGYRPVLATGRSLEHVRERCRAYGLAGGVAEYGSVIYTAADDHARALLDKRQLTALRRLRTRLAELDGVTLDPDYRHAVRAFTRRDGQRRPLSPAQIAFALDRGGAGGGGASGAGGGTGVAGAGTGVAGAGTGGAAIETIAGECQTDFIAAGVNKGAALRALASRLAERSLQPYAFAVGDTVTDLTLAHVAGRALAPGHADRVLERGGFELLAARYQAGLAEAVRRVIGHAPGRCPRCRLQPAAREQQIIRTLLDVPGQTPARMALTLLELWWKARS